MRKKVEYGYGMDAVYFHRGSETKVSSLKEAAVKAKAAGFGFVIKYEGSYDKTKSTVLGWNVQVVTVGIARKMLSDKKELLEQLDVFARTFFTGETTIVAISWKNDEPFVFPMTYFNFTKVSYDSIIKEP